MLTSFFGEDFFALIFRFAAIEIIYIKNPGFI